jgi:signal transduction histidine kinase
MIDDGGGRRVSIRLALYKGISTSFRPYHGLMGGSEPRPGRRREHAAGARPSVAISAQEPDMATSDVIQRASHELRSLLSTVVGYAELLSDGEPGPVNREQQSMLSIVLRDARRLLSLGEDLLMLLRIESGAFDRSVGPVDLSALLDDVGSAAASYTQRDVKLVLDVQRGLCLDGDRAVLQRVLTSLVSHAMVFEPDGGVVELRSHRDRDGTITLTVGSGSPPASGKDVREVLTRYFRASTQRQLETSGADLGMSIVERTVGHLGGSLSLSDVAWETSGSVPAYDNPQGAHVTVRLPGAYERRATHQQREMP